ncbi:FkbM family methyltransferase [Azospirillum formosense]|uniref:FkbM family methyltransferase n=2 Tax=Azospirillum formosense TaxID=861533 RepID=A0ABX2L492_9PROT|nr:FkbM family methyltransferase [Azospirillum formosense]NUB21974.1 FkbM family methyltransferase [Azospirillum formosense]
MAVAGQPAETQYYQALNSVGILNYQNDWVSGEHRFLARLLEWRPDAVVFDVGAHSGDYTRLVRSLSPQARIFSFEPHPVTFETLARVAEEAGAKAVPLGLGDQSHELEIYDYADSDGSQHASLYRDVIERIHKKPATSHTIRIEPLDTVAADLEIERIDLLKVDTEGHELAVFQGGARLFAERKIDVIQFEFNEMNVMSRTFFRDFMEALADFRLFRLLPDGVIPIDDYRPTFLEVFAFQNIVAVRRDLDPAWLMGTTR